VAYYQTNGVSLTHSSGSPSVTIMRGNGNLNGVVTQTGTLENIECSGRGICNHETGLCNCFWGFGSSDGNRGAGTRGDCGFKIPYAIAGDV